MRDADTQPSLVGGDVDRRAATSKVPPVESPLVLAPFRRPADRDSFAHFISDGVIHVEIGFGRGHHLRALAEQLPDAKVLGFEIRRQWCRNLAKAAGRLGLSNVRVVEGDARAFIERLIPQQSIAAFHVLFPDPWWKRKHHKRRLFDDDFLGLLHSRLRPGGHLIAKTDVPAYADYIERQAHNFSGLTLEAVNYNDEILGRVPKSHREKKCAEYTIPVYAFRYDRGSD